ncbi:MAG: SET domain-containing protein [Tepidisphaera sp.]
MIDDAPVMTIQAPEARTGRRVGIALKDGAYRVIATESIDTGAVILEVHGVFVDRPSKYSVQIEENLHVELPGVEGLTHEPDRHPWRYLNHSCKPNAALVGLKVVALRPIRQWDEVTFDYNTTEFEMSEPFACQCGHCGSSMIRGFKYLRAEEQNRLYPRLAGHLRRKLPAPGTP